MSPYTPKPRKHEKHEKTRKTRKPRKPSKTTKKGGPYKTTNYAIFWKNTRPSRRPKRNFVVLSSSGFSKISFFCEGLPFETLEKKNGVFVLSSSGWPSSPLKIEKWSRGGEHKKWHESTFSYFSPKKIGLFFTFFQDLVKKRSIFDPPYYPLLNPYKVRKNTKNAKNAIFSLFLHFFTKNTHYITITSWWSL